MKSYNNVTLIGQATTPVMDGLKAIFNIIAGEETIAVSASGKLAEMCSEYVKTGCLILTHGQLKSSGYVAIDSINILEYASRK